MNNEDVAKFESECDGAGNFLLVYLVVIGMIYLVYL